MQSDGIAIREQKDDAGNVLNLSLLNLSTLRTLLPTTVPTHHPHGYVMHRARQHFVIVVYLVLMVT